jgi:hypothetical protein
MRRSGTWPIAAPAESAAVKLSCVVSAEIAREVEQRARRSGLPISRWTGQAVEVFIAGERCSHTGERPPEPEAPSAEEDQEEE